MALTNDRERRICAKYSKRDENNRVHCKDCPLVKDGIDYLCKANSHYNRHLRNWIPDWIDDNDWVGAKS